MTIADARKEFSALQLVEVTAEFVRRRAKAFA